MEKFDDDDLNRFLEADKINSIKEIEDELKKEKNCMHNFLKENKVNVYVEEKSIHFMFLECNGSIEVIKSVKIDEELKVHFFAGKQTIHI